jgi:F0F1-type ATP synthase membrane subunit b/b'
MKEIVDKILQEEQAARQRLEAARKAAESMVQEAQLDSRNLIQRSAQEAAAAAESRKAAASAQMSREKSDSLEKTRLEAGRKTEASIKDLSAVSQKIFRQVIDIQD